MSVNLEISASFKHCHEQLEQTDSGMMPADRALNTQTIPEHEAVKVMVKGLLILLVLLKSCKVYTSFTHAIYK